MSVKRRTDIEQLRADVETAVERIRKYVDWPHTSPDTIVLDSDLVTITADDLASLLQQFDGAHEQNRKLREALRVVLRSVSENEATHVTKGYWDARAALAEGETG